MVKEIKLLPIDTIQEEDEHFLAKYIQPDNHCICCNMPKYAVAINKAYLSGMDFKDIINRYKDEIFDKYGKKLTVTVLKTHFDKHFNAQAIAVHEYNAKYGEMPLLVPSERKEMKSIFSTLVSERINDIELLDAAMKECLKKLKELQEIKEIELESGQTSGLKSLIMSEERILNNLQNNILTKLKIFVHAKYQSKQMELNDRHLDFLDPIMATVLESNGMGMIEPKMAKEAEHVYLKLVITKIIKLVRDSMNKTLRVTQQEKTNFFKDLQRSFIGIQEVIEKDFKDSLKEMRKAK